MTNNNTDFNDTRLGRSKPRKRLGKQFMSMLYRSEVGLPQDTIKSNTVVRIIVALLIVHIIIIVGVLLRDDLSHNLGTPVSENKALDEPPPNLAAQTSGSAADTGIVDTQIDLSLDTESTPAPPAHPATAPATASTTHITGSNTTLDDEAEDIAVDPAPVITDSGTAAANNRPTPADNQPRRHYVKSKDTLFAIANQYGVSVDAIRKANKLTSNRIVAGGYLIIPDKNSTVAPAVTPDEPRSGGKVHIVKKGETLGAIARKYDTSVSAIQKLNDIKDPSKIRIGQKIKLP